MAGSGELRVLLQLETFNYKLLIPKPYRDESNPSFDLTLAGLKHYLELNQPHLVAQGICLPYSYTFEILDDDFKEYVVLNEYQDIKDLSKIRVRPNPGHVDGSRSSTKNGGGGGSSASGDNAAVYSEPLTGHRRCRGRALSSEADRDYKPPAHVLYSALNSGTDSPNSKDCSLAQPLAPEKRRPGRPRTKPYPDPSQPKRGPGRPRKADSLPLHSPSDMSITAGENLSLHVGRNNSISSSEGSPIMTLPPIKRGPGRPPKNPNLAMYHQQQLQQAEALPAEPLPSVNNLMRRPMYSSPEHLAHMSNSIKHEQDHITRSHEIPSPDMVLGDHPSHHQYHTGGHGDSSQGPSGHPGHHVDVNHSIAAMQQLLSDPANNGHHGNHSSNGQLANNEITVDSVKAEVTMQEGSGPSSVSTMIGSVSSEVSN